MVLLLALGCSRFVPSASVGGLEVVAVDMAGADARLVVQVDNPLPLGASAGVDGVMRVHDTVVAEVHLPEGAVAASSSTAVAVPLRVPWGPLWSVVGMGRDAPYAVELTLHGTTPVGAWSVPVATEGVLPGVALPSLDLLGFAVDEVSLQRIAATLTVATDLPLERLDWSLAGGGVPLVHGRLDRGEGRLALPVVLELGQASSALLAALQLGLVFTLDAVLRTPLGPMPIDYEGRWPRATD